MSDWYLDNAEKLHAANPRSFFIPSEEARNGLEKGDVVRMVFALHETRDDGMSGERMWVQVEGRDGDEYYGWLTNEPAAIRDISREDTVRFKAEHVIAIYDERTEPFEDLLAYVPKRLLEDDDLQPEVVHHDPEEEERPPRDDGQKSSGWDLLVGDETEEQLDADKLTMSNLLWLMERYPAFGELVFSGAREGTWVLKDGSYVSEAQMISATDS
ncbi:DUF2314 domain-containing protein [Solirubrobacter phytolaccae]|uniref:DUF2314 domain-containing protein n=1 Tax=Solirubrobacter phytolaccae TaxID=1404360 RepID=A0A9X3NAU4_9ACTN|nr:DUF2314 domain-containing protein [Solirubrobacter phytolaccae]MDA0182714.1 DUF2314 domain-containing protein [Solirubrobacter phytolaccae]